MLVGKSRKQSQSKLHEANGKNNIYTNNTFYDDENMNELNKIEYPRNTLLRNSALPEKLEKHLNNEKERELESLYEENRQLLMEISKLRKTNQLLVKDVNKKNEIIDNLDSSLVEVEEKLENAKKKNWNMYNEILNIEKKNQQKENSTDSNHSDDEAYKFKVSKIGTFNTVNIIKPSTKKDFTNRPKSTSISTSTENTKWLQDMILESLNEKHVEKKAYDNLKYEVEKLQKEIYSMQTDLLKNNQHDEVIQEPIIDQSNGKLSVFHSNSSNNSSTNIIGTSINGFNTVNSTFHSTSLAQELKEVNIANIDPIDSIQEVEDTKDEFEKENEQGNSESIPPRSVHILMGKTFSSNNNIDKKINKYKNGPKHNPEKSNYDNLTQPTTNYYNFQTRPLQTQINQHLQQPSIANYNNNNYYYSSSNTNIQHQYYPQSYQANCNPLLLTTSTNESHLNGYLNNFQHYSQLNSEKQHINFPEYKSNNGNSLYINNIANHYPIPNSFNNPRLNLNCLNQMPINYHYSNFNLPESNINSIRNLNPFYTQNINSNNYSNILIPPFKIKITQRFRRNRNNSVPPHRPQNGLNCEQASNQENLPTSNQAETINFNNDSDKDLPQGYIRFKTSISSPLSQDDFFSPISSNINNICPCEKAIDSCAAISKTLIQPNIDKTNRMRSSSSSIPLPIPLIAKNNQFQGTSGLLKFSKY